MRDGMNKILDGFAISAPGANTDITGTSIDCSLAKYAGVQAIRVTIALASGVSSVLRLNRTQAGVSKLTSLNSGVALTAACEYTWDIEVTPADTIALQLVTNGAINSLKLYGLFTGVN